jgi:hypothetical protein
MFTIHRSMLAWTGVCYHLNHFFICSFLVNVRPVSCCYVKAIVKCCSCGPLKQ